MSEHHCECGHEHHDHEHDCCCQHEGHEQHNHDCQCGHSHHDDDNQYEQAFSKYELHLERREGEQHCTRNHRTKPREI